MALLYTKGVAYFGAFGEAVHVQTRTYKAAPKNLKTPKPLHCLFFFLTTVRELPSTCAQTFIWYYHTPTIPVRGYAGDSDMPLPEWPP